MDRFSKEQRCPTCGGAQFTRRHRSLWMRLFRGSQLLVCRQCRTPLLLLARRQAPNDQDLARDPLGDASQPAWPSTVSRLGMAAAIVLAMLVSGISGWQLRDAAEPGRLNVLDSEGRGQAPATAASDETRIVVHLTEDDMVAAGELLDEVEDLLVAYHEDGRPLRIEVVSHGKGLALLRERLSAHKARIRELKAQVQAAY